MRGVGLSAQKHSLYRGRHRQAQFQQYQQTDLVPDLVRRPEGLLTDIERVDGRVVHTRGPLPASANIGRYPALVPSLRRPRRQHQDHTARVAVIVLLARLIVDGPARPAGVVIVVERTVRAWTRVKLRSTE